MSDNPKRESLTIVVTGGSSGLGRAIVRKFCQQGDTVMNISHALPDGEMEPTEHMFLCDVSSKRQLDQSVLAMTASGVRKVDRLINCAGINFLAPFNDISEDDWDRVMNTNAKGILFTTQALLDHLKAGAGTVLNIVSNASHMPMTHSAVYNASKGAAHILTLQMARELTRSHGLTVFGISPAKIEGTGMSRYIERQVPALRGWTSEEAAEYQKAGLLTGMEIPPWVLAEFIVWLLTDKQRHFWFDGCVIPYGA